MKIVQFEPNMQPQILQFFEKCFAAVNIPFSPKDRHSDIVDIANNYMTNGYFWCLLENDAIVGTVAMRSLDNKIVELKRLFVLPQYQGKGYGRSLLEYAIDYVKRQQYHKMLLDTRLQFSVARHLYQSMGFKETDKYNDNINAELYYELTL